MIVAAESVLHLYLLTRFSNGTSASRVATLVLHLYLLTRFSNRTGMCAFSLLFYTFTYLQGSQTGTQRAYTGRMFYTFTYLQGSQTVQVCVLFPYCFTPLLTYKVLKHSLSVPISPLVLHLYLLTRFSNYIDDKNEIMDVLHLYLLTRFSNQDIFP